MLHLRRGVEQMLTGTYQHQPLPPRHGHTELDMPATFAAPILMPERHHHISGINVFHIGLPGQSPYLRSVLPKCLLSVRMNKLSPADIDPAASHFAARLRGKQLCPVVPHPWMIGVARGKIIFHVCPAGLEPATCPL